MDCEFCSGINEEDIHALWEALMAVVHGSIAKVRFVHVHQENSNSIRFALT